MRVVFGETIKPSPDEVEAYATPRRPTECSVKSSVAYWRRLREAILGYMLRITYPVLAA